MKLKIEPLKINLHLDHILEIENQVQITPWSKQQFLDGLNAGNQGTVLLFGETLIGYGLLQLTDKEAEILTIAIHHDYQCQGYGRKLLNALCEQVKHAGAHTLFLEVRKSNIAAQKLYHQAGFVEINRRKNYYKTLNGHEDAIILRGLFNVY